MNSTGRLNEGLRQPIAALVFQHDYEHALEVELPMSCQVDLAHLVSLHEAGVLEMQCVARLLKEIRALQLRSFEDLRGRPAPRGLYLAYESYLIERLGVGTAGWLQLGRSRNDLNATVLQLRLRKPFHRIIANVEILMRSFAERAREYSSCVMPAYTHYQPAVPISYGHYCGAVCVAAGRQLSALWRTSELLDESPLGAAAVGGTSVPLDHARTAALLGFAHPQHNSVDAVASRDQVLQLLSSLTGLAVLVSRIAADYLLWCTQEFDFFDVPDRIAGSSSIMPQKKNLFLLEHVQGRAATPLGALTSAVTAMHKAPFSNSICVGGEAVRHVWGALKDISEAVQLLHEVVTNLTPRATRMLQRAREGLTGATYVAEQLSLGSGIPFRVAHHRVGLEVAGLLPELDRESPGTGVQMSEVDPVAVAQAARFGGGPGATEAAALARPERILVDVTAGRRAQRERWRQASTALDQAVREIVERYEHGNQETQSARGI